MRMHRRDSRQQTHHHQAHAGDRAAALLPARAVVPRQKQLGPLMHGPLLTSWNGNAEAMELGLRVLNVLRNYGGRFATVPTERAVECVYRMARTARTDRKSVV